MILNKTSFYLNLGEETLLYNKDNITRKGNAFSFGQLSPGETSKTLIVQLKVSNSLVIKNIRIGLIDSGGLDFKNNVFGIDILNYLDLNHRPKQFFQGINENQSPQSNNNIIVTNQSRKISNFVYLNVNIPSDYPVWQGTVRYGWFYDKG